MPPTRRTHALTHYELEALRRVEEGSAAQRLDDPAWEYLVTLGLVWLDSEVQPAQSALRLPARLRDGLIRPGGVVDSAIVLVTNDSLATVSTETPRLKANTDTVLLR